MTHSIQKEPVVLRGRVRAARVFYVLVASMMSALCAKTEAITLLRSGEPSANTTEPTGELAGSGWQYTGTFGAFIGTPIAPHHFIEARHVGVASNVITYHGTSCTITRWFDDPHSDLRIYEVAETFPSYAPLYSRSDEVGRPLVVIGRGTQRGSEVFANGILRGWGWGQTDMVQRWGENRVNRLHGFGVSDFLYATFDQDDLLNEAGLSSGDSGGPVFMNDGGTWKLAGINFGVDGPVSTTPTDTPQIYGAFFDQRGLYNGILITGDAPVPSGFYSTRISSKLNWIYSVVGSGLADISARVSVGVGDDVCIAGFIVRGNGDEMKRVIVRGLGPSLKTGDGPMPGRLMDPVLEVHDDTGAVILSNDNWRGSQATEIENSGLAPTDENESAIVATLPVGAYTAILRGANHSTGIGLVEIYDGDGVSRTRLANLSTRAHVGTGDNVLIGGLILRGKSNRLLLRALGPVLAARGLSGALNDPTLELHDGNGAVIANNDNWKDAANNSEIAATALAPSDDREAAILMTAATGNYTAIVRGVGATTGTALLEAYLLNE